MDGKGDIKIRHPHAGHPSNKVLKELQICITLALFKKHISHKTNSILVLGYTIIIHVLDMKVNYYPIINNI